MVLVGLAVGAGLVYFAIGANGGPSKTIVVTSTVPGTTLTSTTVVGPTGPGASTVTSTVQGQSGGSTVTSFKTTTIQVTITSTITVGSSSSSGGATQISAQVVSCVAQDPANSNHASCEVTLTNSGSLNTFINGCTLTLRGFGVPGTLASSDGGPATTILIGTNGAQVTVWCLGSSAGGSAGFQALGTIAYGSGGSVTFGGLWQ